MSDTILLDLGEYGEILIETLPVEGQAAASSGGLQQAGVGQTAAAAGRKIKVAIQTVLQMPLTGLAKALLASLPEEAESARWELDEFGTEFTIGIEAEAGTSLGAVAKISPSGSMTCHYTWKRKAKSSLTSAGGSSNSVQ